MLPKLAVMYNSYISCNELKTKNLAQLDFCSMSVSSFINNGIITCKTDFFFHLHCKRQKMKALNRNSELMNLPFVTRWRGSTTQAIRIFTERNLQPFICSCQIYNALRRKAAAL